MAYKDEEELSRNLGKGVRTGLENIGKRAQTTRQMTEEAAGPAPAPGTARIPTIDWGQFAQGFTGKAPPGQSKPASFAEMAPAPPGVSRPTSGVPLRSAGVKPPGNLPSDISGRQTVANSLADLGPPPTVRTPLAMPSRQPENNDQIARNFLATESAPRDPGKLDINNTREIQGLAGVEYAGKYGKTDVFTGVGRSGERSFSDLENLSTNALGRPAAPPEGARVVNNFSGMDFKPDQDGDGLPDQTSPELVAARQAAVARGDLSAVERSYMNPTDRKQYDLEQRQQGLQNLAYQADPAGTYAEELGTQAAQATAQQKAAQQQQTADRADRRLEMSGEKNLDSKLKNAVSYLDKLLPVDYAGNIDPAARSAVAQAVAKIAKENPGLDHISIAQMAFEQIQNPESATDAEIDQEMTALIGMN